MLAQNRARWSQASQKQLFYEAINPASARFLYLLERPAPDFRRILYERVLLAPCAISGLTPVLPIPCYRFQVRIEVRCRPAVIVVVADKPKEIVRAYELILVSIHHPIKRVDERVLKVLTEVIHRHIPEHSFNKVRRCNLVCRFN